MSVTFKAPQKDQKIHLTKGLVSCEIWPEIGGGVASLSQGDTQILRATPAKDSYEVTDLSSFPLVPYSNRIKDGAFEFEGRKIVVPRGPNDPLHALHGHGWIAAWKVEETTADTCKLSFARQGDAAWPFSYRAEQHIVLLDDGAELTLVMENTGTENMPAGVGFHPYFPRPAGAKLEAKVEHVWLTTPEVIPTDRINVPAEWDLNQGLDLSKPQLDNCFTQWSGVAKILLPNQGKTITMSSDDAQNLVVYCPKGQDFVCVEPVTNVIDAHNHINMGETDTGLVTLRPHEKITMKMKLQIA